MFKSILCSSEGFEIPVIDEEIIYELVGRKSAFKHCREAILQLFFFHTVYKSIYGCFLVDLYFPPRFKNTAKSFGSQ